MPGHHVRGLKGEHSPRTSPAIFFNTLVNLVSTESSITRRSEFWRSLSAFILSLSVLLVIFYTLSLVDFKLILFVRSLQHPAFEELGSIGNWLGDGLTLVLWSLTLLGVGYFWKNETLRDAGLWSLIAHAIAGLGSQIPKHVIGRPRPYFTHQDQFEFGPSFQIGLDAFPSGHASATFAVAAIMAKYFPKATWGWYGIAIFVAISRIVKGAHFPTDAIGGAVLGYIVGYILSHPIRSWRVSLFKGVSQGLPIFVGMFTLLWCLLHPKLVSDGLDQAIMVGGIFLLILGMGLRLRLVWNHSQGPFPQMSGVGEANLMIGLGFALSTGLLLVAILAGLTGLVWVMNGSGTGLFGVSKSSSPGGPSLKREAVEHTEQGRSEANRWRIGKEILVGVGVAGTFFVIQGIRGLMPLL